jgi:hypothetical protein
MGAALDNTPVLAQQTLQQPDIQPMQQGVTQATQALNDAVNQGIITFDDLAKEGFVRPRQNRAAGQLADEATLQSQARQSLIPDQTALNQAKINSGLQILPSTTQSIIAGNDASTAQSQLGQTQAQAQQPSAELLKEEMQQDPTGQLSAMRQLFQTATRGTVPIPRKPGTNSIDYDAMKQAVYHAWYPNAPMPQNPGDLPSHAQDMIDSVVNEMMWQDPSAQYWKKMAEDKNQGQLLFDPKTHKMRTPWEAREDIAEAPYLPKPSFDDAANAAKSIPEAQSFANDLATASQLVDKPGVVGPEYYDEAGLPIIAKIKAGIGNATARQLVTDRANLQQVIGNGVLNQIRSLSGSGAGRVLGSEFNTMKEDTVPELSATPEYWHQWLNKRYDLINRSLQINQQIAAGKNPDPNLSVFGAGAPQPGTGAPQQLPGGKPLSATPGDVTWKSLKKGDRYTLPDGRPAIKLSD